VTTPLSLRISRQMGSEKMAVEQAGLFAKSVGFDLERIEDIKTAVAEAAINAIEHADSGDLNDGVEVRIHFDTPVLKISVSNKGGSFVPSDSKPDIKLKIEGKDRPRGWGIYMIRKLADKVEFSHEGGISTVQMNFILKSKS
jgi:serine/threonine-protein kinase RsbW